MAFDGTSDGPGGQSRHVSQIRYVGPVGGAHVRKRSSFGGFRVGSGSGKMGVRYPPLPKWMEKLPGNRGRRKGSGKEKRVGSGSGRVQ